MDKQKKKNLERKLKRRKKGFKIEIRGVILSVSFAWWNQRAVQCTLTVDGSLALFAWDDMVYTGKALCNVKAGDKFDLKKGQELAFKQALEKYDNSSLKPLKILIDKTLNNFDDIHVGLMNKFDRQWEKIQSYCEEIEDTTSQD